MPVLDPRALPFDELINREWLITNGAGGYASSTVAGLNTRKYHGLLVAAMRPPVGRMVVLSRVEETVVCGAGVAACPLGCAEYPGVIHPRGHELLRAFDAHPYARWAYQGDGWTLEKSLRFSPSGPNDLVITWTLLGGAGELELHVRPLFALRSIHELSYQWSGRLESEMPEDRGGAVRIPPTARTPAAYFSHDGIFQPRPDWYLSTIYRRERERGYAGLEDLWTPGTVSFRLAPGRAVHLAVSTEPIRLENALLEIRREEDRRQQAAGAATPPGSESTMRLLNEAGERFFVWTSPTDAGAWTCIIPQFPWTPLAVRDILIATPGLLLAPGKLASARTLLTKLAGLVQDGLLPSELSETGEPPAYNAVDVALWYIHCVGEYLRYANGGDRESAARLMPVLRQIIDAYRTDVLAPHERGLGGSLAVFGYRVGMILSGGIALIWAEQWGWSRVYEIMAWIMVGAAAFSLLATPRVTGSNSRPLTSDPLRELVGFFALVAGVLAGALLSRWLLMGLGLHPDDPNKWVRLLFVLAGIAFALPLGGWAARKVGFETLNQSLSTYFAQPGAWSFLLLIVLYKLSDAFAGSLTTPFLIKGMAFTQAEVGIVNKIIGIWLTIFGALLAGALMLRLNLYRSLLLFGLLQMFANFGFYTLAVLGRGAWGGFTLQPFDLGFVAITQPAQIDSLLMFAIAAENITSGMGTAAFVALLMSLCNQRYTATHYALLSALASIGRIYVSPLAGVIAESIGWPAFFIMAVVLGVPGVYMVWRMRDTIAALMGKEAARP